jgi:uncharacterized membrane protein
MSCKSSRGLCTFGTNFRDPPPGSFFGMSASVVGCIVIIATIVAVIAVFIFIFIFIFIKFIKFIIFIINV